MRWPDPKPGAALDAKESGAAGAMAMSETKNAAPRGGVLYAKAFEA